MDISGLFSLQMMMFLLMGIGFFLRKKQIITHDGKALLTNLVINIFLPCNIIHAFSVEFDREILTSSFQMLLVSLCIQLFCTLISTVCYQRLPKAQRVVFQYATVCSNAGLLGNPVAEGLYGSLGLLYASVYMIPQRIVMWSAGVSYFTHAPSRREVFKQMLKHPCIIAVAIGVFQMLIQVPFPAFLQKSIANLGGCTTAVTMLLIGTILAEAGLHDMLSKPMLAYSFIRLVAIPAVVLLGCQLCHIDSMIIGLSVVLAAMPAGTTTVILAAKYHGDEVFATNTVVWTTLLSMLLLPVWCLVLSA